MKFVYYFNGNDFDYEIDDNQIKDFLIDKMLEEGKMERNKDNVEMARFMINRFNLYEDEQILEDYKDEMEDYFEYEARELYEDCVNYEDDKNDWFGTKSDVVGV